MQHQTPKILQHFDAYIITSMVMVRALWLCECSVGITRNVSVFTLIVGARGPENSIAKNNGEWCVEAAHCTQRNRDSRLMSTLWKMFIQLLYIDIRMAGGRNVWAKITLIDLHWVLRHMLCVHILNELDWGWSMR